MVCCNLLQLCPVQNASTFSTFCSFGRDEDEIVFPTPNRGLLRGARDVWVIVPDSIRLGQTSRTLGWGGVETDVYNAEYRPGYNAKIIIYVSHKIVDN